MDIQLTEKWETFSDIKNRTGAAADEVIDAVKAAYAKNKAVCRFMEVQGVKITEWSRK